MIAPDDDVLDVGDSGMYFEGDLGHGAVLIEAGEGTEGAGGQRGGGGP